MCKQCCETRKQYVNIIFCPVKSCDFTVHALFTGPTILFTHFKIILLQFFQFSVSATINSIQTNPQSWDNPLIFVKGSDYCKLLLLFFFSKHYRKLFICPFPCSFIFSSLASKKKISSLSLYCGRNTHIYKSLHLLLPQSYCSLRLWGWFVEVTVQDFVFQQKKKKKFFSFSILWSQYPYIYIYIYISPSIFFFLRIIVHCGCGAGLQR